MTGAHGARFGSLRVVCCTPELTLNECVLSQVLHNADYVLLVLNSHAAHCVLRLALYKTIRCTIVLGRETHRLASLALEEIALLSHGCCATHAGLQALEQHIIFIAPGETKWLHSAAAAVMLTCSSLTPDDCASVDSISVSGNGCTLTFSRKLGSLPAISTGSVVSAICGSRLFILLDVILKSGASVVFASPIAQDMLVHADMHRGYLPDFAILGTPRHSYNFLRHVSSGRLSLVYDVSQICQLICSPNQTAIVLLSPSILSIISPFLSLERCVQLNEYEGEVVQITQDKEPFLLAKVETLNNASGLSPMGGLLPSQCLLCYTPNGLKLVINCKDTFIVQDMLEFLGRSRCLSPGKHGKSDQQSWADLSMKCMSSHDSSTLRMRSNTTPVNNGLINIKFSSSQFELHSTLPLTDLSKRILGKLNAHGFYAVSIARNPNLIVFTLQRMDATITIHAMHISIRTKEMSKAVTVLMAILGYCN